MGLWNWWKRTRAARKEARQKLRRARRLRRYLGEEQRLNRFSTAFSGNMPEEEVGRAFAFVASRLQYRIRNLRDSSRINLSIGIFVALLTIPLIYQTLSSTYISRFGDERIQRLSGLASEAFSVCLQQNSYSAAEYLQSPDSPPRTARERDEIASNRRDCSKDPTLVSINGDIDDLRKVQQSTVRELTVMDLYNIISRFLLIAIVQFVSFFFLRLYVGNEADVKYLINEMSNFEAKYLAYLVAKSSGDQTAMAGLATSLASVERNNILRKGERLASAPVPMDTSDAQGILGQIGALVDKLRLGK